MKTVLHTIDTPGPGGAETVCVELASRLDRARFRSVVGVLRPGWAYEALRLRGLDPSIVRAGRGPIDLALLARLTALARRSRADLLQCHLLGTALYGSMAARLLRLPSVATFHGMVDISATDRWSRLKLRLITANVSRLVFVSEALRRHFCQTHGIAPDRTAVVPNGVDIEQYHPDRHGRLRLELGLPEGAVLVGAVGNIRPPKGYDELLRVAAHLRRDRPEIRFVVAGEPGEPLMSNLLAQRRALGLEDRVIFLGFRDDVPWVLNGLDIYLSTSTSEGFSLTAIQAMACGLAVVATRSGGPEDILTDGADGLLVPVGDTAALSQAVADLAADAGRRRRMGESGREAVLRRFTVQRMVATYESIYDEALAASA